MNPPKEKERLRAWLTNVLKPLCETIDGLHDNGLYGDLKAANILMTSNDLVIDFGLAMDFRSGLRTMNPQLGTQSIMSPEQHHGRGIGPLLIITRWAYLCIDTIGSISMV